MRKLALCGAFGAAALAMSGCHQDTPPPAQPVVTAPSPSVSVPAPRDKAVVYVVNPKATGEGDMLMPRTVALRHSASPVRDAVDALLHSKGSPLPPDTALRGITVDNGLATLDFSRSPINESGGEAAQSVALNALSQTLGQFPEIHQYQIEVKGQPIKSLGEEGTPDGPLDVIRPDAVPQAQGPTP